MSEASLGPGLTFSLSDRLTFHIFHDHAQVAPRFKGAVHADHKGVFCKRQDVPLHEGLLDLVPEKEVLLIDLLHGEALPGLLMPDKVDCPEKEHESWGSQEDRVLLSTVTCDQTLYFNSHTRRSSTHTSYAGCYQYPLQAKSLWLDWFF